MIEDLCVRRQGRIGFGSEVLLHLTELRADINGLFAQGLFDERASVTQVHVTPDEQHAYGVVGIPSQPDTDWALLVVDDLT